MRPPVSVGRLALQLITTAAQITFLQDVNILPVIGACHNCGSTITTSYKERKNQRFWHCGACNSETSLRHDTVLYKSKLPLNRFVMLVYCFTQRNKTYSQVINECCLPNEAYADNSMSTTTVNRWFTYFRHLCSKDWLENLQKIGGKGTIVEIDESMFGKLKYGRGDGRVRRKAWVFGIVSRETNKCVLWLCPRDVEGKFKRTKPALWPIIQAFVKPETMIYSDGFRGYRKLPNLGYGHKWVDHSKEYVNSEGVHTNQIEGLWGVVKRWLPSSGPYNLQEYLQLFQWFQMIKEQEEDPFWRLMDLISENNSLDMIKVAEQNQKKPDTEGEADVGFLGDLEDDDEEEDDDYLTDDEEQYWYDCIHCKMIFESNIARNEHMVSCNK